MSASTSPRTPSPETVTPWWSVREVWVMLGGPAIVVVAGIATAVIAFRGHDPEVAKDDYSTHGAPVALHQATSPTASHAPADR